MKTADIRIGETYVFRLGRHGNKCIGKCVAVKVAGSHRAPTPGTFMGSHTVKWTDGVSFENVTDTVRGLR